MWWVSHTSGQREAWLSLVVQEKQVWKRNGTQPLWTCPLGTFPSSHWLATTQPIWPAGGSIGLKNECLLDFMGLSSPGFFLG